MYTGDQARFYAPIAQLCPNANIHLDTTNITGGRGGVFSWQHGITIDPADMAARVDEPEISPYPQFSPDLAGRHLAWGDQDGSVSVADLEELRRRLNTLDLGW